MLLRNLWGGQIIRPCLVRNISAFCSPAGSCDELGNSPVAKRFSNPILSPKLLSVEMHYFQQLQNKFTVFKQLIGKARKNKTNTKSIDYYQMKRGQFF